MSNPVSVVTKAENQTELIYYEEDSKIIPRYYCITLTSFLNFAVIVPVTSSPAKKGFPSFKFYIQFKYYECESRKDGAVPDQILFQYFPHHLKKDPFAVLDGGFPPTELIILIFTASIMTSMVKCVNN